MIKKLTSKNPVNVNSMINNSTSSSILPLASTDKAAPFVDCLLKMPTIEARLLARNDLVCSMVCSLWGPRLRATVVITRVVDSKSLWYLDNASGLSISISISLPAASV